MCTAIVRRGRDVICGFNLDLCDGIPFRAYMDDRTFWLGIDVGGTVGAAEAIGSAEIGDALSALRASSPEAGAYRDGIKNGIRKIEGVNRDGNFGVHLGSQDNRKAPFSLEPGTCPIDSLIDGYISGRSGFGDCLRRVSENDLTNPPVFPGVTPEFSMHGLMVDRRGRILLAEPGTGYAVIREKYFVMTNFDLLEVPAGLRDETFGYFGRDRYDTASAALRESGDGFRAEDALRVLESVRSEGSFSTRFSFVYSNLENRVYYAENGDFSHVKTHTFPA